MKKNDDQLGAEAIVIVENSIEKVLDRPVYITVALDDIFHT